MSDSLPHFRQALSFLKPDESPRIAANLLSNYALANWASGNDDVALRQLGESLALTRTIQDIPQETIGLNNIAAVYAGLGDDARALDFYRQAQGVAGRVAKYSHPHRRVAGNGEHPATAGPCRRCAEK